MADDGQQPLGDYLDDLIYAMYGAVQRGVGYVSKSPLHSAVIEYIEDEKTGRPHPIDDSADHYLLRAFDNARRHFAPTLSNAGPERGERRLPVERWSDGYVGPGRVVWELDSLGNPVRSLRVDGHHYCDEVRGEIPWRAMHDDPDWPCPECGHAERFHYDDEEGYSNCSQNCNCGWNIGR